MILDLPGGYRAIIDDADAGLISGRLWYARPRPTGCVYVATSRSLYMHRRIMQPPAGLVVDHINGDGLDCRRSNMRICTRAQNNCNQRRRSKNTSGCPGVAWVAGRSCWVVQIRTHGRTLHVGRYDSLDEAKAARYAAEIKHFGAFAPHLCRVPA